MSLKISRYLYHEPTYSLIVIPILSPSSPKIPFRELVRRSTVGLRACPGRLPQRVRREGGAERADQGGVRETVPHGSQLHLPVRRLRRGDESVQNEQGGQEVAATGIQGGRGQQQGLSGEPVCSIG